MTTDDINTNEIGRGELFQGLANLLGVAALIETSLAGLEGKRVTLEEKMIKSYLTEILTTTCDYVRDVHSKLIDDTCDIDVATLKDLLELVSDMQSVFQELSKSIAYDWNYLEQYYEHGFYARLHQEHRFKERLQALPLCVTSS